MRKVLYMAISLGKKIKNLRTKHGLTRQDLADKTGLTYAALSKYETDEREPDYETLFILANFFNVTLDKLLDYSSNKNNTIQIAESNPNYDEIIAPFPTSGNPLENLPEDARKELEHYTEFLYQKWKGWKPGDPPR
jgi:transcriptional regulator with XRE-family HTH domain